MSGVALNLENRSTGPFRVGESLSIAFSVLGRHFIPFLAITAVASIPNFFIYMGLVSHPASAVKYGLLESISERILGALCQAMVLYATFQDLRGRPVNLMESIGRGLARFIPVVVTSVLVGIIVGIGTLLLIVPGVIAATALMVALPACVVERLGPIDSVTRSQNLTSGYKGAIFGALFGIGILNFLVVTTIGFLVGTTQLLYAALIYGWITLTTCYMSVVTAIIYHGLRVSKEGVDIEQIASVFD